MIRIAQSMLIHTWLTVISTLGLDLRTRFPAVCFIASVSQIYKAEELEMKNNIGSVEEASEVKEHLY